MRKLVESSNCANRRYRSSPPSVCWLDLRDMRQFDAEMLQNPRPPEAASCTLDVHLLIRMRWRFKARLVRHSKSDGRLTTKLECGNSIYMLCLNLVDCHIV